MSQVIAIAIALRYTDDLLRLRGKVGRSQVRVARQDIRLDLRQAVERVLAEAQVVTDDLLGRKTQPLRDGNVVVDTGLKNLCSNGQ